jgi:hypothetical protein
VQSHADTWRLDSASPARDAQTQRARHTGEPPEIDAPRVVRTVPPPVMPETALQPAAPVQLTGQLAQLPVTIVTRLRPRRTPLRFVARTLVAPLWASVAVLALGIDALFVLALMGIQL